MKRLKTALKSDYETKSRKVMKTVCIMIIHYFLSILIQQGGNQAYLDPKLLSHEH